VLGTALGRGGIGVAPEAELINVKVLSDQGSGSSTGIAQGIRWAVDEGATIISMSLGSSSPHRPTQEAMQYAAERGVTVVSAAGNSGQRPPNNTIGYPARYLESGCIGAKQQNGQIASFSSAGREMGPGVPGSRYRQHIELQPHRLPHDVGHLDGLPVCGRLDCRHP
jgi:subtilisin